jgi:aromatic-L-amino-acid decarboxylase
MTEIEARVIRWMCQAFGYPAESAGVLTSGGSIANFSAVVAARTAHLGDDLRGAVMYTTDQAHYSVQKAARLAGLPSGSVRVVDRNAALQMDPEALGRAIAEDRAAGRRPFCVVANAGTTNTGAVDPLDAVADVCQREGLWLHVDGAYGGFFQLTERGRALFRGIDRADSITLDPHKCMFLPYGTGALIARDGQALRRAHMETAEYLQDLPQEHGIPSFAEFGPEMTRDFRGLRVWLPLMVHGVAAFRDALDEKLDLTRWLYEDLRTVPGLELPWEPSLSITAFRAETDEQTRAILDHVNASGRVFVSSTTIDGRVYIRPCIVVVRTHKDRVEELAALIREAAT